MKIILDLKTEEEITALYISLYMYKKQAFEDWLFKECVSSVKINRKIMQAYTSVYNQLYQYNIPYIIKPKIKGVSKKIKIKKGGF